MKVRSLAWVLMSFGVSALAALAVLVTRSDSIFEVAVMAANGNLDVLIHLTKWRSEVRLALAVVSLVALVLVLAPLWLVRRAAAPAGAKPVAWEL